MWPGQNSSMSWPLPSLEGRATGMGVGGGMGCRRCSDPLIPCRRSGLGKASQWPERRDTVGGRSRTLGFALQRPTHPPTHLCKKPGWLWDAPEPSHPGLHHTPLSPSDILYSLSHQKKQRLLPGLHLSLSQPLCASSPLCEPIRLSLQDP